MSRFLGPLDASGRIPPGQQTRVAAFLISAHGALARQLALALAIPSAHAWRAELNAQVFREAEIVSLIAQATCWVPDVELLTLYPSWEAAWLIRPAPDLADQSKAVIIDVAALGHAVHGAIRPAAILPEDASRDDSFVEALRRIEFESGRLIQAQILFLKSPELTPIRAPISAAVESRHTQVRALWRDMLAGIGVGANGSA